MARSPLIGTSTQAAEANYDHGNKRERGAERGEQGGRGAGQEGIERGL